MERSAVHVCVADTYHDVKSSPSLDMLDPALTRAGRFDRHVTITLPDRAGREAILRVHAKQTPLAAEVDLAGVARVTHGFSGAELANIINEASLLAAREHAEVVSRVLFDEAIERVMLGVSSRRHVLNEAERHAVAYHEAGHAVVGRLLPGVTVPHKVTIVPRGEAQGYVWGIDREERAVLSRSVLLNQLAMLLAGRAAEELVLGEPGAGAAEDLARASMLARRMVCEYGMSDTLGSRAFGPVEAGLPGYSEDETRAVGVAVGRIIDDAQRVAYDVLSDERAVLDLVADALLEHETLSADQLDALWSPGSAGRRSGQSRTRVV